MTNDNSRIGDETPEDREPGTDPGFYETAKNIASITAGVGSGEAKSRYLLERHQNVFPDD